LIPGERYVFSYRVTFHSSARNVKFYCMTKTVNGVHLGGGKFPAGMRSSLSAAEGDVVDVCFEFDGDFGAGAYFFNCGVASSGELLHRILDVVAFRVVRGPTRPSMGAIDLNVLATVTSVTGNVSATTRRSECTNP
jgi:lipopolysaccharide transport system ATP-binding protein